MLRFSEFYSKTYKIYCDLDGVLVNFEAGATKVLGSNWKEIAKDEKHFWSLLAPPKTANFFGSLSWMPDGQELWSYIKKYHPTILTGVGNAWGHPQKRGWVQSHLGKSQPVIIVRSSEKYKHAGPNSILIDDRPDLIRRWKEHGGIGIRHKSTAQTIAQLQALGL